jgi:hypothetical protein
MLGISRLKSARARFAAQLLGMGLLFMVAGPVPRALAEDNGCNSGYGNSGIAACTAQITSGSWRGKELVKWYLWRANIYRDMRDYDRALSDFHEALTLDPKANYIRKLRSVVYSEQIAALAARQLAQPQPVPPEPSPVTVPTAAPVQPAPLASNPPPTPAVTPPALPTPLVNNPTPTPTAMAIAQQTPVANTQAVASNINVVISNENAAQANTHIADLKSQIAVLTEVLSEQAELQKTATDDQRPSVDKAIEAVNAQIEKLRSEYSNVGQVVWCLSHVDQAE